MVSDARGILVAVGRWWLMELQEAVDVDVDGDVDGDGDEVVEDDGNAQPELRRGGRRNRYL